jgi:hypothetical protein
MMTKREFYEVVIANMSNNEEVVAHATHQLEILNNRNANRSNKPSKRQVENVGIKDRIKAVMSIDTPMTVTEITNKYNEVYGDSLSNNKINSLVTQLKQAGEVVRTEVKKVALFTLKVAANNE